MLKNIIKATGNIILNQKKKQNLEKYFTSKRCIASKLGFFNGINKQINISTKQKRSVTYLRFVATFIAKIEL